MSYPNQVLNHYQTLSDPNASLHREVSNVISSYNNPWDPLAELIQNAVDAINQRAQHEAPGFRGKIKITIDSGQSTIKVEDNGIGIEANKIQDVLIPGGSLKTQGQTYGHKGLGFTYCAHVSAIASVETEHLSTGNAEGWSLSGGFDWIKDQTSSPNLSTSSPGIRSINGPGTSIELKLCPGQYEVSNANTSSLESFFEWADDQKLLTFVLRTRTAVGNVDALFGNTTSPDIEVEVCLRNQATTFSVDYKYFDLGALPPMSAATNPDAQNYFTNVYDKASVSNKSHHGIRHVFKQDTSGNTLKVGRHHGGIQFQLYLYAVGKENLNNAIGSYDSRLARDGEFHFLSINTAVYLAIDGMPCGNPIDAWASFGGFYDRFFAIVRAELSFGSVLDSGRKTISPHYAKLFMGKLEHLIRERGYFGGSVDFYMMAQQLNVGRRGTSSAGQPNQYVNKWSQFPSLSSQQLGITVEPDDELSCYLLFGELAGRNILPGFSFRYVSGAAIYDAALSMHLDLADPMYRNQSDGGTNPAGVGVSLVNQARQDSCHPRYNWKKPTSGIDYLVTEFKVQASELIKEVQQRRSQKVVSEIDLLVCWEADPQALQDLGASLIPVNDAGRTIIGHTHDLHASGHAIAVIELREIVNFASAAQLI